MGRRWADCSSRGADGPSADSDADHCGGGWQDAPLVGQQLSASPSHGCLCRLSPVLLVCVWALYQWDHALSEQAPATEAGQAAVDGAGGGSRPEALSYTAYYSIKRRSEAHGGSERLEVAEGRFDAVSGRLLSARNLTKLHARKIEAVKASPDWRYVVFIASFANDLGNLYAVGTWESEQDKASAILDEEQLDALDSQCQYHSKEVERLWTRDSRGSLAKHEGSARHPGYQAPRTARLAGLKHLEVIVPDVASALSGRRRLTSADEEDGAVPCYRLAVAFECRTPGKVSPDSLQFSKLAVIDIEMKGRDASSPWKAPAIVSELRIVDAVVPGGGRQAAEAASRYVSQCCPRFVPSSRGYALLFVVEDPEPAAASPADAGRAMAPFRRLAVARLPSPAPDGGGKQPQRRRLGGCCDENAAECLACQEGTTVAEYCTEKGRHVAVPGCEEDVAEPWSWTGRKHQGLVAIRSMASLLDIGRGRLPTAPVRGCPEFVPGGYLGRRHLGATLRGADSPDTLLVVSDLLSAPVLGADAQVLSVSLRAGGGDPEEPGGGVSDVQLLYNMDAAPQAEPAAAPRLSLEGCRPIRSATPERSLRLRLSLERLTATKTSWFACLAADGRFAVAESSQPASWTNLSMPTPREPGPAAGGEVWCPPGREADCFDLWANESPAGR